MDSNCHSVTTRFFAIHGMVTMFSRILAEAPDSGDWLNVPNATTWKFPHRQSSRDQDEASYKHDTMSHIP
jgi:hypothetical protein